MNKTEKAILRIQEAYEIAQKHKKILVCAYSGGKDSDVLLDLCKKSGVPFRAEHNHTTIDAPETVYHIREVFSKLDNAVINKPETTMWALIKKKLTPPTRIVRYCCDYLKERKFDNQHLLLGVRWAESNNRKSRGIHETIDAKKDRRVSVQDDEPESRKVFEVCYNHNRVATNPIIDWTNTEIWKYVRDNKIIMNPLYECGFKRVGCIGCPMARKFVHVQFERNPKYREAYIRTFDKMLIAKRESYERRGLLFKPDEKWKDGETIFKVWTNPNFNPSQLSIDDVN
jgi:phosphoadenosine phosphosulfate reductase